MFNENAKEAEIRKLLRSIDGRIIEGPSANGLYVIAIKNKEKRDLTVDFLRKSKIVFFAEPIN